MTHIAQSIKEYISSQLLRGEEIEVTAPLLELGIISSMSMVKIVKFLGDEFGVQVPSSEITPEAFKDVNAIAELVERLKGS